jgi:hypothetical protein
MPQIWLALQGSGHYVKNGLVGLGLIAALGAGVFTAVSLPSEAIFQAWASVLEDQLF